jgi:hypothetical protein
MKDHENIESLVSKRLRMDVGRCDAAYIVGGYLAAMYFDRLGSIELVRLKRQCSNFDGYMIWLN